MMTTTTTNFTNRKLLIDVFVTSQVNTKTLKKYKALIDTGSMETLLSDKVISELSLTESDQTVIIKDASGNEETKNRYDIFLMISEHTKTFTIQPATKNINDADIILGMDIIELIDIQIKNDEIIIKT